MPAKNGLSILIKVQNAFLLYSPVLHMVSKFAVFLSTVWNVNSWILRLTNKRNLQFYKLHSRKKTVKKNKKNMQAAPLDKYIATNLI